MFRPINIIRWLSSAYAFGFGLALLCTALWELIRDGNLHTGGKTLEVLSVTDATMLVVWLACCVVAGWNAMDREAGHS